MDQQQIYALSIKQPWATLLVSGLKSIEVRGWSTKRRGRVLIHAGRIPDRRRRAWAQVPEHLREAAGLLGGIVGAAELTGCVVYRSRETFATDKPRHLNDPAWFRGKRLFGFSFANMERLDFLPCLGALFFFPVDMQKLAVTLQPGLW
jgi:hypothetical protein